MADGMEQLGSFGVAVALQPLVLAVLPILLGYRRNQAVVTVRRASRHSGAGRDHRPFDHKLPPRFYGFHPQPSFPLANH